MRLPSRRGWLPCNDGLSAQRFPASTRSNCGTAPDRVGSFRFHRRPDGKHQPPAQRLHIFGCRYEIVMRRIKLLVCGILYCMYGKDFSRKVPNFTTLRKNGRSAYHIRRSGDWLTRFFDGKRQTKPTGRMSRWGGTKEQVKRRFLRN